MTPHISRRRRLDVFLASRGIAQWDYCLFGDGSGSRRGRPYGWSCVVVRPPPARRTVFFGAGNRGSSIVAELAAFVQPLAEVVEEIIEKRETERVFKPVNVHAFTDNEYAVDYFSGRTKGRASFLVYRAAVRLAESYAVKVHWHHIDRESEGLNSYVDRVGRAARKTLEKIDPDKAAGIISVDWATA